MSTYTPGRWRVTPDGYVAQSEGGYVPIRTPFREDAFGDGEMRSDIPEEVLEANARLIAQVPRLVDALGKLRLATRTMTEPEKWGGRPENHIPWQMLTDEATAVLREAGAIE